MLLEKLSPTSCAGVASRDQGHRLRPHDAQVRVIERHPDVLAWIVQSVDPVTHVGCGSERLEPMQKSGRNVEMTKVLVIQKKSTMLTESRRFAADIDNHIVNRSVGTPDQFSLPEPRTAVQAADHALCRSGLRVLQECAGRTCSADESVEDGGVESSGKQTAGVMRGFRCENRDTGEVGLFDSHGSMLP